MLTAACGVPFWRFSQLVPSYHLGVQVSSATQSCLTLRPHGLQHARPPCPSPTPGVHSESCPSSWWCRSAISSSVVPFSSCPQSSPASGSFPTSQLFESGGQSIGVSFRSQPRCYLLWEISSSPESTLQEEFFLFACFHGNSNLLILIISVPVLSLGIQFKGFWWQPTPVFLPRESHGQRGLAGYTSPWGHKESDTTEWLTHTHTHTHT